LKRVAAARPDDVEAWYLLGNTQLMAGKHDDAIKTLNKVLVMDPSHSEAQERLRVSTVRKNLWPHFQRQKQEVEEQPANAAARAELGQTYNAMGMFADAEQGYLRAVALEPKNADSRIRLCVNYAEWGKLEQGIECYQQALKLKPHHVLFFSLGDLYQRQGKFEEAGVAYQKAIELMPSCAFALYELGFVLMKQGKAEEAIEPLRRLLEVEPKHIYGNHALGLAYVILGNKTGAMQQYYVLQTLNPRLAADLLKGIPQ
jgi:tetratricopeptide (TPR) repeat protein